MSASARALNLRWVVSESEARIVKSVLLSIPDTARAVRLSFLVVLLVLFVPSRLMALAHGAEFAQLLGASVSTLAVSWLLYRLCVRTTRQAWFIAISLPAVYIAVFAAPIYAWGVLVILFLLQRWLGPRLDEPRSKRPITTRAARFYSCAISKMIKCL